MSRYDRDKKMVRESTKNVTSNDLLLRYTRNILMLLIKNAEKLIYYLCALIQNKDID